MIDGSMVKIMIDVIEDDIRDIFERYGEYGKGAYISQVPTGDELYEQIMEKAQEMLEYGAFMIDISAETLLGKIIKVHVLFVIDDYIDCEKEEYSIYISYRGCTDETE